MNVRDLDLLELVISQSSATAVTGDAVDAKELIGIGRKEVGFLLTYLPTGADTDETLDGVIQESATTVASDFAALQTAVAFTQVLQTATAATELVYGVVNKRYVRAVITPDGTTPLFTFSASAIGPARVT